MVSSKWRPTSKATQIILLLISTVFLTLYFLPIHENPPLMNPNAKWCYHYREILISNGNILYEIDEILRYAATNLTKNILVVEIKRTFEYKYSFGNESRVISPNTTESLFSFVNIRNRLYVDGTYTSWWIPSNVFIDSSIPVWNMNFRVKGLSWVIVNGKPIECWLLECKNRLEEYTLLYERVTGFFVQFRIKTMIQPSQQIIRERRLIDTDVGWPPLTIARIPLLLIGTATSTVLLYSYIKKGWKKLRKARKKAKKERYAPIIYAI